MRVCIHLNACLQNELNWWCVRSRIVIEKWRSTRTHRKTLYTNASVQFGSIDNLFWLAKRRRTRAKKCKKRRKSIRNKVSNQHSFAGQLKWALLLLLGQCDMWWSSIEKKSRGTEERKPGRERSSAPVIHSVLRLAIWNETLVSTLHFFSNLETRSPRATRPLLALYYVMLWL